MRFCLFLLLVAIYSVNCVRPCRACDVLGDTARPPQIHFTALDSGATVVHGTVTNVCRDSVAVVLWALTNHWYVQPLCTSPLTQIDGNGDWSTSINGWERVAALLVNRSRYTVPAACQLWDHPSLNAGVLTWDGGVPAPTLFFSGYTWIIKHGSQLGPGDNRWADGNAWIDQSELHLRTSHVNGTWRCAEVLLDHSLGYGTYTFQLASRVDSLDSHAVFSGFVYDSTNRELDFEFSHAIGIPPPYNAQYVVQPYTTPSNREFWTMPAITQSTHRLLWTENEIVFTSWAGWDTTGSVLHTWIYGGNDNPPARGRERMRFNLWLDGAQAQLADEIVVHAFAFQSALAAEPHRRQGFAPMQDDLEVSPNPFNSVVHVTLGVHRPGTYRLTVYDLLGRQVATAWKGRVASKQDVVMDAARWPSGLYFLVACAAGSTAPVAATKLMLLK